MVQHVMLREIEDQDGTRRLMAIINQNGDLLIEGIDRGPGVERIFSAMEYEWVWTIPASEVPKLCQALQTEDHPLTALQDQFSGENATGLKEFLQRHGIFHQSWSRTGD